MNKISLLSFLWISITITPSYSQIEPLRSINEYLIGPENVSYHLEEQKAYYSSTFETYSNDIEQKQEEIITAIEYKKSSRKRLRSKDKQAIKYLEKDLSTLKDELASIIVFTKMWDDLVISVDAEVLNDYHGDTECYEIESYTGENYQPKEYTIKEITGKASWDELTFEPQGEPKWVKKKADQNCLSANPEDCLVWCLVETKGCQSGFDLSENEAYCRKTIQLERAPSSLPITKFISLKSGREIIPKQLQAVTCQ